MSSVVAKWEFRGPGPSRWNPTITAHGRIYHYIGALNPPEGLNPAYIATDIHDTDYSGEAVRWTLDGELLQTLASTLTEVNSYVQTFKSLRDWANEEGAQQPSEFELVLLPNRKPAAGGIRAVTTFLPLQKSQRL